MKKIICLTVLFVFSFQAKSQLLPTIGINSLPKDTTQVCTIPWYLGNFYTTGYQQGDTVNDFKLYNLLGDSLVLSDKLNSTKKPILLVAGNLTCPVFRNKVPVINQVATSYSNNLSVYVIYNVEAHPTDTSPYFGVVNITNANNNAGILFPQPKAYGDRKHLVDTMSSWVNLNVPVFIDGPCNYWWSKYGPAPNNSYLIDTNGIVLNKHGWFHKVPDNIYCDLDSIFGVTSGFCSASSGPGSFTVNVISDSVAGPPGAWLYDYADVINTETTVVTINCQLLNKLIPSGWQTAICADVCYPTGVDSVVFSLNVNDTLHFSLDFLTDLNPDTGTVRVGFRNVNNFNNKFAFWMEASTLQGGVGIGEFTSNKKHYFYPNPSNQELHVKAADLNYTVRINDLKGKEIYKGKNLKRINTSTLKEGVYMFIYTSGKHSYVDKLIIKH